MIDGHSATAPCETIRLIPLYLSQVGADSARKTLIILRETNEAVILAGRNIEKLAINTADRISVFDVLNADKIIIEHAALEHINAFYGEEAEDPATA